MSNKDNKIKERLEELANRLKLVEFCKFEKYIRQINVDTIPEIDPIFVKETESKDVEHVPENLRPKFTKAYIYTNEYTEKKDNIKNKLTKKPDNQYMEKYIDNDVTDNEFKNFIKNFNTDLVRMNNDDGNKLLEFSKRLTISYHYMKSNP